MRVEPKGFARPHSIAGVYSDLLEEAGVDTVKELGKRRFEYGKERSDDE